MKIVAYIFIALFVITIGAGGFFFLKVYQPMADENASLKAGMPELERAKSELRKMKDKDTRETAWIKPAADILSSGLADEISEGKTEVVTTGTSVIVNIHEDKLYMPGSYIFAKDSSQLRAKLVGLLMKSEFKGKEIIIGNTTEGTTAQIRGRNKIPAKDARTLAAERSGVLIKDFEKSNVPSDMLVAAAYSSKQPEIGIALKSHKTVISIANPPSTPQAAPKPQMQSAATSTMKSSATATAVQSAVTVTSQPPQPRAIPIRPAQPQTK
jgi:hypothetical protein